MPKQKTNRKNNSAETLRIGPINYWVIRTTFPEMPAMMGRMLYETATIEISESLSGPVFLHTTMHEVIHALLYHGGELEHDERVVELLAHGLMLFMQDNPAFVRRIQQLRLKM